MGEVWPQGAPTKTLVFKKCYMILSILHRRWDGACPRRSKVPPAPTGIPAGAPPPVTLWSAVRVPRTQATTLCQSTDIRAFRTLSRPEDCWIQKRIRPEIQRQYQAGGKGEAEMKELAGTRVEKEPPSEAQGKP